jgi:alpha-glucosidase
MQPAMLHTGTSKVDPLILHILPLNDNQHSSYSLYEDSSQGRGYMTGEFSRANLTASRSANVLTITVAGAQGSYPGMLTRRRIQVDLPGDWPPSKVEVNGQAVSYTSAAGRQGWWFEGNTLTTSILTDEFDTAQPVTIVVSRDPASMSKTALLDGFAGKMTSLRHAYDAVNGLWPIDDLVTAMQTGDRITYHPENAATEVARLGELIRSSQTAFAKIVATENAAALKAGSPLSAADGALQRTRTERLAQAAAALKLAADTAHRK